LLDTLGDPPSDSTAIWAAYPTSRGTPPQSVFAQHYTPSFKFFVAYVSAPIPSMHYARPENPNIMV